MSGTIVRNIHRADIAVIATLERLGVATVHEAQGRSGLMQPYLRPVVARRAHRRQRGNRALPPGRQLVNLPVVCAGVNVKPGDVVVADDDGVVVVPRLEATKVAQASEEREKKEAGNRARLQRGELGLDINDMRKSLAEKGLRYVDGPLE